MEEEDQLKSSYANPSQPGSYSGLETFFRALKHRDINIPKTNVKIWLLKQDAYTLHNQLRRKFKRNKVIVTGIDDTWQIDLADMRNILKHNSGHRYIITCIDVFSKYAWAIPIKNKQAATVKLGFEKILESTRQPKHLQSDKGTEFFNKNLKTLLDARNINLYAVNSDKKACIVERFNRTLKEKMYRYFTHKKTYRFLDILQPLIDSYNNTYHTTLKMSPNEVNKTNEKDIWQRMYNTGEVQDIKFKLNIDDKVRVSKYKHVFEKGYTANWSDEIFIVTKRVPRVPPVYEIKDLNNEDILGIFYEQELQRVLKEDEVYRIDHIIRRRKNKTTGQIEYFVRWLGYTREFDSWIQQEDFQKYQQ
jgi:hypothetical protein